LTLALALQAFLLLGAVAVFLLTLQGEGRHRALQLGFFWWILAAGELGRAALGLLEDPILAASLAAMAAPVYGLGITIHLTQRERARKDGYPAPMSSGVSWLLVGIYLLGAGSWVASLLQGALPPAATIAAMVSLGVVVASALLVLAAAGLALTRDRTQAWAVIGLALTLLASGVGWSGLLG